MKPGAPQAGTDGQLDAPRARPTRPPRHLEVVRFALDNAPRCRGSTLQPVAHQIPRSTRIHATFMAAGGTAGARKCPRTWSAP